MHPWMRIYSVVPPSCSSFLKRAPVNHLIQYAYPRLDGLASSYLLAFLKLGAMLPLRLLVLKKKLFKGCTNKTP